MGFRKLRWQGERWRDNTEGHCDLRKNIFMTFSLSLEIFNFIPMIKVNDFFCFLLKTELVWYFESCHLYHCRSGVSGRQLVSVCSLIRLRLNIWHQEELPSLSCRKYYLKLNSEQFTTDFVGMERVTSKSGLKSKSNCSIPQLLSTSASDCMPLIAAWWHSSI